MGIFEWLYDVIWLPVALGCLILEYYFVSSRIILHSLAKKRNKKVESKVFLKKKKSFLKQLLIDLPHIIAVDRLNYVPYTFNEHGIIIFEGIQGRGKTISAMKYASDLKVQYERVKILSNTSFSKADCDLLDASQLVTFTNGVYGVIAIIDETQNWFSSKDSKNFPPEMLQVVTQNRKNKRIIIGTAQQFYMLAKDIRTQCTEVRSCFTILGCITFVLRRHPTFTSEGEIDKMKYRGIYWYVHTEELRDSYDTYRVIERLARVGFKDRPSSVNINVSKS